MSMRRWVLQLAALLCCCSLPFLAGCSSGDISNQAVETVRIPAWDAPSTAMLRSNVVTVPDDGVTVVSNVTDDGFTLAGSMVPLQVDQVVVTAAGGGLMRKIVSVTALADGSRQVTTLPATLEDVIHSGALRIHHSISAEDLAQANITLAPGVTLDLPRNRATRASDFEHTFTLNKLQVGGAFQVEATGALDIKIDIITDFEFDDAGVFQRAIYFSRITTKTDLNLEFKRRFESPTLEVPYGSIDLQSIPIPSLPGMAIKPKFSMAFTIEGECEAAITVSPSVQMTAASGLEFARANGFAPQPVGSFTIDGTWNSQQHNFFAQAKVTIVPVQVKVAFLIGPIIGPGVGPALKVDVPGVEFAWNEVLNTAEPKSDLTLSSVIKATISADAGALANLLSSLAHVPQFEKTLFEDRHILAIKTFRPGEADITLQ
jgi:hypothetical protein